jgi:hypothetical protein
LVSEDKDLSGGDTYMMDHDNFIAGSKERAQHI